jgi:Tol biopolymer transport system component
VKLDASGDHAITVGPDDSPVWSPDGGSLAFARSSGGLYVVQRDGQGLRRVPGSGRGDSFYGWSPDGTSVAFGHTECAFKPFNLHFMVVNLRTGRSVRVAAPARPEKSIWLDGVSWSPDGKRLVYVVSTDPKVTCHGVTGLPVPTSRVYTIGADGRGRERIASTPWDAGSPEWSPDGRRIALISDSWVTFGNADGSGFTQMTNVALHGSGSTYIVDAAFADGGRDLAVYVSNHDSTQGLPGPDLEGLFSVDAATRRVRSLVRWNTTADSNGSRLAVSQDGKRIGILRSDGTVFVLAGNRILYRSQKKFSGELGISLHLQ